MLHPRQAARQLPGHQRLILCLLTYRVWSGQLMAWPLGLADLVVIKPYVTKMHDVSPSSLLFETTNLKSADLPCLVGSNECLPVGLG
jgi:hypothetical protein